MYILMLVHLVVFNKSELRISVVHADKFKDRSACEQKARKYRYEYPRRFVAARCIKNKEEL